MNSIKTSCIWLLELVFAILRIDSSSALALEAYLDLSAELAWNVSFENWTRLWCFTDLNILVSWLQRTFQVQSHGTAAGVMLARLKHWELPHLAALAFEGSCGSPVNFHCLPTVTWLPLAT